MEKSVGGGTSLDLLKRLAKKGNAKAIAALRVKKSPPTELAYILHWYLEIRRQAARGFRFEPVQMSEIVAYQQLFGLEMNAWEVGLLLELDVIWQKAQPEPEAPANTNHRRR